MSGATEHLPRLLALVPWLLAHPNTPVADVAKQFDVTEAQVRRDLDLIFVCGLPGYGPGDLMEVVYDGDRVSLANVDAIDRPLRLTREEALALVVALRALLGMPGIVDTDAADRALAKLESATGDHGASTTVAVAATPGGAPKDVVERVAQAVADARRLHLRYWVPARDEATERDVDPIRMFTAAGVAYLVGWCRLVGDVRTFRLDRALAVDVLDVTAEVPDEARERATDAGAFTTFTANDGSPSVTFELEPEARWVADYYPCEEVTEGPDGRLTVRIRARDRAWVRRLALTLAGRGRVVAPDDLAAEVRAVASATLANYANYAPNARTD